MCFASGAPSEHCLGTVDIFADSVQVYAVSRAVALVSHLYGSQREARMGYCLASMGLKIRRIE